MIGIYRHDIHGLLQWASDITRPLVDMISLKLFGTQSTIFTATVRKAPAICKTSTQNLQYVNVAVCMFVWQVWPPRIVNAFDLPGCLLLLCHCTWRSLASSGGLSQSLQAVPHFPHLLHLAFASLSRQDLKLKHFHQRTEASIRFTFPVHHGNYEYLWLMIWSFTSAFRGLLNLDSQGPEACEGSFSSCLSNLFHIKVTVLGCAPAHKCRLSIHSHRRL